VKKGRKRKDKGKIEVKGGKSMQKGYNQDKQAHKK
jgi:hypothetical protein